MSSVVSVFGVKPFRIGGTETFARELSRQLHERGMRSVLCFLDQPTEEVRSFLNLPNTDIEVLSNATNLNWNATNSLAQILRKHRAQLLHLHFTGFLGVYPWLGRLLSVRKIFFSDHSSRPAGHRAQRASLFKRLAARIINHPVTKVVCVSRYGEQCLSTLDLLPQHRHQLVYNAVDLSRVQPDKKRGEDFRKRLGIPDDRVVVVQVSWMIPEKGIPDLLKVARMVGSKNENVHFVLVGEGAHREEFMRCADEMGLANRITWTGLVADPFSEGVYDAADVVCQLSEWEELFGWMIAEGMAYGKPILATRVGGIPELVTDGVSGYLVERGDLTGAAEQLDRLARDPQLRKQMGEAGHRIVKEKFNLERNVAQLIALYDL